MTRSGRVPEVGRTSAYIGHAVTRQHVGGTLRSMVQSAQSARVRLPELEKYEVLEEIGHGGMATVYRARDRRLGREVAVKIIHPHLRESSEVAHRFQGEAQAVAKLRHPNIVEVYDVSEKDDHENYLVVELVRGQTLRRILKEGGELPPEVAAALGIELLGALGHAHTEGVIHRDVKPENVMIEHRVAPTAEEAASSAEVTPQSRVRVKLMDFGIAKLLDAQGVTSTGQVLGSPAHMAPEQIEGGEVDVRADVFGLGVLMYEAMVGHLPFEGTNPAQVLRRVLEGSYANAERERPRIGRQWSAILDRALAREPKDRFENATEFKNAMLAELERLGMPKPRDLLTEYFDDPAAFNAAHEKHLVDRLAKLGIEARKNGDHVAAAAYTNRALAYAPNDPRLMAIATSLGRREAGLRAFKRGGSLLLGMIAFALLGFGGTRLLRNAKPVVVPTTALTASVPVTPEPRPSADPSAVASVVKQPPLPAPPLVKPLAPAAPVKERMLVIDSVFPDQGVLLSLDKGPPQEISAGTKIPVSRDPHVIDLTCKANACEPEGRTVPAGDKDYAIDLPLRVLPATLIVEGEGSGKLQIEKTGIVFNRGEKVRVPMKGGLEPVYVVDVATNAKQAFYLKAGKENRVTFTASASLVNP